MEQSTKDFEDAYALQALPVGLPIIARLDGRGFSKLTANMHKPFDCLFSNAMKETAKFLLIETQAELAYTQSDEITLVLPPEYDNFSRRIQKLCSVFAGLASAKFNFSLLRKDVPGNLAVFDCRVFTVPSQVEVWENLKDRRNDAIKNSVSMAAHAAFGHKQLLGRNTEQRKELLRNGAQPCWEAYDQHYREGTLYGKEAVQEYLTKEEF